MPSEIAKLDVDDFCFDLFVSNTGAKEELKTINKNKPKTGKNNGYKAR